MANKLKPCRCGCTDIAITDTKHPMIWSTYVFCRNDACHDLGGYGISMFRKVARRRAVRDWNRRNKHD